MAEVDTDLTKAFIRDLKVQIDDRMQKLCDKITRIRDNTKNYERDAVEQAYAEIEPMRRQMEAMIKAAADYESLKAPLPVLLDVH